MKGPIATHRGFVIGAQLLAILILLDVSETFFVLCFVQAETLMYVQRLCLVWLSVAVFYCRCSVFVFGSWFVVVILLGMYDENIITKDYMGLYPI